MRIVNVSPHPRHLSYASSGSGGRTLGSGEQGPEIDVSVIHNPQFLKDLEAKLIRYHLSKEDKEQLKRILKLADEPIVVQKPPKPPKKQKPKPKPKEHIKLSPANKPKPRPGQPDLCSVPDTPIDPNDVDLSMLHRKNESIAKRSKL